MILLGVGREDNAEAAAYLAEKSANLRIFNDAERKMNRSLIDIGGAALVVSQFTLYGDARWRQRSAGFHARSSTGRSQSALRRIRARAARIKSYRGDRDVPNANGS